MATQTLAEAGKHIQDELVAGVVETIVTEDPIHMVIPNVPFEGNSITVNSEDTLGDVQYLAIGGTITAKTPSTANQTTFTATKIIGDAEVDGLVAAQSSSAGRDLMAAEVMSKAKNVGEKLKEALAIGTGTGEEMHSLHTLCDASQYTTASTGQALSFELLDELLDLVKGGADYILMSKRTVRSYRALVRSLGGVAENIAFTMPDGQTKLVAQYLDIPIFSSESNSVEETANGAALTGGALTSVWAGKWDDGTKRRGLAFIYPGNMGDAGFSVAPKSDKESKDEAATRIKRYGNFVLFAKLGLARLTSINN